jgi:hypothetical protein
MSADPAGPAEVLFPYCLELRSKKLAFSRTPPRSEDDILDASNHCWCATTKQALGPDNELVRPEDCRSGRECYRPVL